MDGGKRGSGFHLDAGSRSDLASVVEGLEVPAPLPQISLSCSWGWSLGIGPPGQVPRGLSGDRHALDLKPELSKGTLCRGSPPPPSTVQGRQRWGTE